MSLVSRIRDFECRTVVDNVLRFIISVRPPTELDETLSQLMLLFSGLFTTCLIR